MMVEVICDLQLPNLMSRIVDEGINNPLLNGTEKLETVLSIGGLMLLLGLLGAMGGMSSSFFAAKASQSFGRDLRKKAFGKIMHLSFEQTDKFTTGSLVTRLSNDITMVTDFVTMALRMFIRSPFMLVGGLYMLITMSGDFGLILAIACPLLLLTFFLFLRKATPLFSVVQKKLDKVNNVVQENVTGARVVKAYVREEHEIKRFDEANVDLVNTSYRVQKILTFMMPIIMIIMNLTVVAVITVGGFEVDAGNMKVGAIMSAMTYLTMVLMSFIMVGNMAQHITRAFASVRRVNEVLDTEPVIKDGTVTEGTERGTVSFKNVTFAYPSSSGEPVLSNISFDVKRGETVAIMGATGSGKTSLINLIPRFYDATEGEVFVDGVNVKEYTLAALRKRISVVSQKTELFSGSIRHNILQGKPDASDAEIERAITVAQAKEFIDSFEEGIESDVGEKGMKLSGGQRQRVSIARGVIRCPEIMIMDDSMSALDLSTDARLRKALKKELSDTTVIMVAQRVATVMSADRIIILENGTIVGNDSHERLLESCEAYQTIYNSQLKKGDETDGR
ncbi:MAG: ABC transporter ATP-binding protein [Clostridia bacterium]|nr:ABC transporter ATP-binding protein [Clostridia bacterium]